MAIDQLLFWLDSLTGAWQGMDGNGVAGMIITSDYGSFRHSLLSTSKSCGPQPHQ